jgi:hypothetical protein
MMDASHLPLDLAALLALAAGLGWASGLRLYTTLFVVGLAGRLGWIALPDGLRLLEHPWVLGAAGVMLFVEFFADKIPLLDSIWDTVHTFIRIPAGAALAAMVFGGQGVEWQTAVALLGGTLAAGTHLTKAGTRAMINASPEPFSNIAASASEDVVVLGGLWLMFAHPWLMLALLLLLVMATAWLLPKLWRGIAGFLRGLSLPRRKFLKYRAGGFPSPCRRRRLLPQAIPRRGLRRSACARSESAWRNFPTPGLRHPGFRYARAQNTTTLSATAVQAARSARVLRTAPGTSSPSSMPLAVMQVPQRPTSPPATTIFTMSPAL